MNMYKFLFAAVFQTKAFKHGFVDALFCSSHSFIIILLNI